MKYIERPIEDALDRLKKSFSIVLVTGARQTGKNTLLKNTFPDIEYVIFDNPADIQSTLTDAQTFLRIVYDRNLYPVEIKKNICSEKIRCRTV